MNPEPHSSLEEIFDLDEIELVDKELYDLIDAMEKNKGIKNISILFSIWSCINFDLLSLHKESPSRGIQSIMNKITISQNCFINEGK